MTRDARDRPVISIGGAPSSGTTLLADLIDSLPGAACDPELGILTAPAAFEWSPDFVRRAVSGATFPSSSWYSAPRTFFNSKYLELVGLTDADLVAMIEQSSDLPDFVNRYRRHRSERHGREVEVFAEKTPTNVATASRFLETFPAGLFIHVVRDPRQNVASFVSRGFGLAEATATWCHQVSRGAAVRGHDRVMTIRYEDLTERPFDIAADVAARVGLTVSPTEIRERFERNSFRAQLPRVGSWRASESNEVMQLDERSNLGTMDIGWVERQSLWHVEPGVSVSFISSVSHLASVYGYPSRVIEKARFDRGRLASIFRQFVKARDSFDHTFCVTEPKSTAFVAEPRLPMSTPREWRVHLDTARPWIGMQTLEQIAIQATLRHQLGADTSTPVEALPEQTTSRIRA